MQTRNHIKAVRVFYSCKTKEHYDMALEFAILACQQDDDIYMTHLYDLLITHILSGWGRL